MPKYIKHGPKGSSKVVDKVDDFIDWIKACHNVDTTEDFKEWEFQFVEMSEEEFNNLPEFEGF